MDKENIDKEESGDTIDIPVQQQEFTCTYVYSEDLNEQVLQGIRGQISSTD